ncbi:MAG: hypothetical protein ACI8QC_002921 [Planctomycetota bacterium]|jgi:hypothetical protein
MGPSVRPMEPVPKAAHAAYREALRLDRAGASGAAAEAWRATQLAPDWEAPWRWLDDWQNRDLLGLDALRRHWQALEEDKDNPLHLYLAARLENAQGSDRFERASRVEPRSAWAWHGRAFKLGQRRRYGDAASLEERAVALARAPEDAVYFMGALVRFLGLADRREEALEQLDIFLEREDLGGFERMELRVAYAELALRVDDSERSWRGQELAVELLGTPGLSDSHRARLLRIDRVSVSQKVLAMGPELNALGEAYRLERYLREETTPLALALIERSGGAAASGMHPRSLHLLAFAGGDVAAAVEDWRAGLPGQVVDSVGVPLNPRLARLVRAARAMGSVEPEAASSAACRELGQALVEAGWFSELLRFASRVPAGDVELALELDRKARAGLDFVSAVEETVKRMSPRLTGSSSFSSGRMHGSVQSASVKDIEGLLETLRAPLMRVTSILHEPDTWAGTAHLGQALTNSTRLAFGWLGAVLHPGPYFSAEDQRLGRGKIGEQVPGLAAALDSLGRVILTGEAVGVPMDLALLRVLHVEPLSGQHLGRPWRGTIFWCDGTDIAASAGRNGANLAGAALHEGYWVDINVLRMEHRRWTDLAKRFEGRPEAVTAALAQSALPARAPAGSPKRGSAKSVSPLLGESNRVRLAVLRERGTDGKLGTVSLGELVQLTAIHEEGHLCDRAQFYPLEEHLWSVVSFAMSSGVSAQAVQQRLEYRAQLVALASAPEPRLALVDLLDAAEVGGTITPHAAAYTRLLEGLLDWLADDLEAHPEAWPQLDKERRLAHQLHLLGPEQVRAMALAMAAKEGLVGSDFSGRGEK